IFVGVASFLVFSQQFSLAKMAGVIFFLMCLWTISLENYRREGQWGVHGLLNALAFIVLDSIGIVFSRLAFDSDLAVKPLEGHLLRSLAAVAAFAVIGFFRPIGLFRTLKGWETKETLWITVGSFFGTFASLVFYLSAVKIGHLGSMTAVAMTGPLFTGS